MTMFGLPRRRGNRYWPAPMLRLQARMRPFCAPILLAAAMIQAIPAGAQEPSKLADNPESGLPSGNGAAFRQRMMSWSTPSPEPSTIPESRPTPVQPRRADLPRLSSKFGARHDPIRGVFARHAGVDIPAPLGTPIFASADGSVRFAGSAGGYGNMVEIEHPNGIRTRYAHLSRILVGERSVVKQGQIIALMGSTGRSTGSHLHFEMRANGAAIDPLSYLANPPSYLDENEPPRTLRITPSEPFRSAFARANAEAKASDAVATTGSGAPDR
jgi:murein DD-endopeptidase MepM/ murein hydrolase activator NlpD